MPNNLRWDLTILLYPNQLPKADFVYFIHERFILKDSQEASKSKLQK